MIRSLSVSRRCVLRLLMWLLPALALSWLAGLVWFAATVPDRVEDTTTHTDAIVVLTGGSERTATGIALLAQGLAGRLFISGVHRGVEVNDILRLAPLPRSGATPDSPIPTRAALARAIVLGHAADDTVGNAAETAAWMEAEHLHSLRLVTAAYHMRRGLWEFRQAMPEVRIIPNPVFPDMVKSRDWWRWPGTAALLAGEYTKYLGAIVRQGLLPSWAGLAGDDRS
jgi:uncharacterized SAM-binding protein YcdF (DUF218 family)